MRPLLHLFVLLAAWGFFLPVEPDGAAAEGWAASTAVLDEGLGSPIDPAEFRLPACIFGAGTAVGAAPDNGRARSGARHSAAGPPAKAPRMLALCCPPPRSTGAAGPLPPGESAPGQLYLRVNGSADAHGSRA